jgi:hypothetical protein
MYFSTHTVQLQEDVTAACVVSLRLTNVQRSKFTFSGSNFNFLASHDVCLNVIFYTLVTRLKIKTSEKTDQQDADNV